ncbi:MAG: glycosyltransferase family 39 protein [Pirellulaceae bacterium]|nr:glycosyltransferase family 39 protein [Pirellulaceae bacterium]
MTTTRTTWWIWAGILALALGVRIGSGIWWQSRLPAETRFRFGDSDSYWEMGKGLAQGQPLHYGKARIFRTPGYPLLLAGMFKICGDGRDAAHEPHVLCGRLLSAALGTIAVGGVGILGYLLFGPRTAAVAGVVAALYPEAIALSTFVLSEAPFCPLMVMHLVAWTLAWQAPDTKQRISWSIAGGIAAGLATLMRPSWLLFLPFAVPMGLIFYRERPKQLVIAGIMLAGLCVTMLPWWIRNYQIAGRFVPTTLQVGASLYDGISPQAKGTSEMSFVPRFVREQMAADVAAENAGEPLVDVFEDRLDRRMQAAAVEWAGQNPGRVFELAGIKFLRMWSPLPNAVEFQSTSLRLVLAITYTPVILLALVGVGRFAPRGWPYLLCFLPAVYFTLLHCVFVSSLRYRQPAMLVLIVLAAGVVTSFIPAIGERIPSKSIS